MDSLDIDSIVSPTVAMKLGAQNSEVSMASVTSNIESDCIRKFEKSLKEKHNMAYAVIMALNHVIQNSHETTILQVYQELDKCSQNLLDSIRKDPNLGDRTLLPIRCLIKIFLRISRSVTSDQFIEDIRASIHLKGITLAEHTLNYNTLIRKFSEPHLREGMVSIQQRFLRIS